MGEPSRGDDTASWHREGDTQEDGWQERLWHIPCDFWNAASSRVPLPDQGHVCSSTSLQTLTPLHVRLEHACWVTRSHHAGKDQRARQGRPPLASSFFVTGRFPWHVSRGVGIIPSHWFATATSRVVPRRALTFRVWRCSGHTGAVLFCGRSWDARWFEV